MAKIPAGESATGRARSSTPWPGRSCAPASPPTRSPSPAPSASPRAVLSPHVGCSSPWASRSGLRAAPTCSTARWRGSAAVQPVRRVLDSTMDRIADGAIFGAVAWWLATSGHAVLAARRHLPGHRPGRLVRKARAKGLGSASTSASPSGGAADHRRRRRACSAASACGWAWRSALWLLARSRWSRVAQRIEARVPAGRAERSAGGPSVSAGRARLRGRLAAGPCPARAGGRGRCSRRRRPGRPRSGPGGAAAAPRNLRRVVGPDEPEPSSTRWSATALRSYARYWMEAFRLPALTRSRLRRLPAGRRQKLGEPRAGPGVRGGAAARRQLGRRRRLGRAPTAGR